MKWTAKRQYDVLETGICRNLHRVRVDYILNQISVVKKRAGKPLRILDIGCGDGVITKRIQDHFPEEEIKGLDVDKVRLDRARTYCKEVAFQQSDVCLCLIVNVRLRLFYAIMY